MAGKRGGYLAWFGLWDWYTVQPQDVQDYIYQSSGYGINTDPQRLVEGDIMVMSSPDDPYPPSATTFLCGHARNAYKDRLHDLGKTLLDAASQFISSPQDESFFTGFRADLLVEISIIPDQKCIDRCKIKLLQLVKETPGILQAGVRSLFPAEDENAVGYALSQLRCSGKIRREKKGRSFQLWVVD